MGYKNVSAHRTIVGYTGFLVHTGTLGYTKNLVHSILTGFTIAWFALSEWGPSNLG